MSTATTFAVTTWSSHHPIDLRVQPPAQLRQPVASLLEAVALAPRTASSTPSYLPEDFLAIL